MKEVKELLKENSEGLLIVGFTSGVLIALLVCNFLNNLVDAFSKCG